MHRLCTSSLVILLTVVVTLSQKSVYGLTAVEKDVSLTLEQKKILDEFKALVISRLPVDYMKEDIYLVRWLRARNWNINRAEVFLESDLKWRKENKIDNILEEDWSDFEEQYKYSLFDAKDKEGKPILYFHVASWDLRRAVVTGQSEKFLRYIDSAFERAVKLIRELGNTYHNVSQAILIVNLDGYNLAQHGCVRCIPVILRAVLTYENHYPGYADKIFLLNTPSVFQPLLESVRGVLNTKTNEAISIFGKNRKEWQKALLDVIDESELSSSLGGTKVWKGIDDDFEF